MLCCLVPHSYCWCIILCWVRNYIQPDSVDTIHYGAFIFQYTTYLAELVLSVFPEPKPKQDSKETEESLVYNYNVLVTLECV